MTMIVTEYKPEAIAFKDLEVNALFVSIAIMADISIQTPLYIKLNESDYVQLDGDDGVFVMRSDSMVCQVEIMTVRVRRV